MQGNFNPRSPCGERPTYSAKRPVTPYFNPRSPCGERLPPRYLAWVPRSHFNPRSPCGERHMLPGTATFRQISTHAPHAGSDLRHWHHHRHRRISTHAPHAGSDSIPWTTKQSSMRFQPTLPMRGATMIEVSCIFQYVFQPTLPMRGATCNKRVHPWTCRFQPTLPMRGATGGCPIYWTGYRIFQPTLPMRGATGLDDAIDRIPEISTHAPHAGSDNSLTKTISLLQEFQPTLPMRGATLSGAFRTCAK